MSKTTVTLSSQSCFHRGEYVYIHPTIYRVTEVNGTTLTLRARSRWPVVEWIRVQWEDWTRWLADVHARSHVRR